jgi:hypothetical protein
VKIPTPYISSEEWQVASTVVRAISRSHAMINADVLETRDGNEVKIFSFVPTREVYLLNGDSKKRMSQSEFAAKRQRAAQAVGEMFAILGAPNKGKGIKAKKAEAREMFRSLIGDLDPAELGLPEGVEVQS